MNRNVSLWLYTIVLSSNIAFHRLQTTVKRTRDFGEARDSISSITSHGSFSSRGAISDFCFFVFDSIVFFRFQHNARKYIYMIVSSVMNSRFINVTQSQGALIYESYK